MADSFAALLSVGGKTNSLGKADEVIGAVLKDRNRLDELYDCLFEEDSWVRMRAADSIEKICRVHPEWIQPYVDRYLNELSGSAQASIKWHLAQIYQQVDLSTDQRRHVIDWLKHVLSSSETDWIVATNAMQTVEYFTKNGWIPKSEAIRLFEIQTQHRSKAVVKRAVKLIDELKQEGA